MISDRKIALFYKGTIYRKKSSRFAVELVNSVLKTTEYNVYFFDEEEDAKHFICIYNKAPVCPIFYDLSEEVFNGIFNETQFGVAAIYRFNERFKIGEGFRSKVYAITRKWVVRCSSHPNDGFLATYQIPDKYRERLMLPKVDRLQSDVEQGVVFVEKLYQVNTKIFDDLYALFSVLNDPLFHMKKGFRLKDHISQRHPFYAVVYNTLLICRYLRLKGHVVTMDLHPSNIMVRDNGSFVLNDVIGVILNPFSTKEIE